MYFFCINSGSERTVTNGNIEMIPNISTAPNPIIKIIKKILYIFFLSELSKIPNF